MRRAIVGKESGEWTRSDSASVSRALRRLEARGLIMRNPASWGTRTVHVRLTLAGEDLAIQLAADAAEAEAQAARVAASEARAREAEAIAEVERQRVQAEANLAELAEARRKEADEGMKRFRRLSAPETTPYPAR